MNLSIAAASIAQVHRGKLKNGDEVVVRSNGTSVALRARVNRALIAGAALVNLVMHNIREHDKRTHTCAECFLALLAALTIQPIPTKSRSPSARAVPRQDAKRNLKN